MRIPRYVRLLLQPPTLDFERAIWEVVQTLVSPRKVFKAAYYRQQTKNQWARDDPSFVVLLSVLLVFSAIAWGLAYTPTVGGILKLILYMVIVDFLAMGVVVATATWAFANRFLKKSNNPGVEMEWAYSFDIHCNAFLVIWVNLYVVQFVLLPILDRDNWFSKFLGNTLYFGTLAHYCVITFLGYSSLPFLEHTEYFLAPVALLAIVYFISLFSFSMVRVMLAQYFN